jgi:hypothetical protein
MKKIIFTTLTVLAFGFANAQEIKSSKGENYLPESGDWAIGFNANNVFRYIGNSFNGSLNNAAPTVNYQKDVAFVGKKFITSKSAYRVIANLGFRNNFSPKDTIITAIIGTATTNTINKTTTTGFDLKVGLGKEWRRGKTRLQGFYGADALITLNSGSTTNNVSATTTTGTTVTNATIETVTKSGFGFGFGVQGFLGAEYFLFPKISIGAQYTYGVGLLYRGKVNVTTTTSATGATGTSNSQDQKDSAFGFNLGSVGVESINLTLHF